MKFEGSDTPTYRGGESGEHGPVIVERLDLVDRDGVVVAHFDKTVSGEIRFVVDDVPIISSNSIVLASGTTHSDPGSSVTVALDEDHSDMSDADFLTYVRRNFRVVQTGDPPPAGFAAVPFYISEANASAGTISVKTIEASIPFEVVRG